jgi:hypothetical protein
MLKALLFRRAYRAEQEFAAELEKIQDLLRDDARAEEAIEALRRFQEDTPPDRGVTR